MCVFSQKTIFFLVFLITLNMTELLSFKDHRSVKYQSKKEMVDRWLVIDFDGTCTVRDTTSILPKLSSFLHCNGDDLEARVSKFKALEEKYYELYREAQKQICPQNFATLDDALVFLDRVSTEVTSEVSNSGVLRGLNVPSEDIICIIQKEKNLQEDVKLYSGCLEVIARAQKTFGMKLGVLSINWCPSLIEAALLHPLQHHLVLGSDGNNKIPIWSNSVDREGIVKLNVQGALAKKDRIMRLQKQKAHVIYIGDSSTDLGALLEADVGILIGCSKSAISLAEKWGISFETLKDYFHSQKKHEAVIWTANSWKEIGDFLAT